MTTIESVTAELINKNIRIDCSYSVLPKLTYDLVINVLHFGPEAVNDSTLGQSIKDIALDLAIKDGRSPSVCPKTYNTILV